MNVGLDNSDQESPAPQVKWEKILWRRQPFPDNYVPESFLSELKHLPPRPRPRLVNLFFAALPVTQHVTVITFFIGVFYALLIGSLGPGEVGWSCAASALLGFGLRKWGWGFEDPEDRVTTDPFLPPPTPLRPLILPPLLLALLSPVLGTLTSATTSDSIWPLAGGLFFVHLLLADFTTGKDARLRRREARKREEKKRRGSVGGHHEVLAEEKSLTSSLSLTSALSASVVLASRLPSTSHVFSLVLLAVLLFAGWPVMAKGVREAGKSFSLMLTVSLLCLTLSILPTSPATDLWHSISPPTLMFFSIIVAVNLVGPIMLWYGWRWKTRRGGNWEVAVVKIRKGRSGQG